MTSLPNFGRAAPAVALMLAMAPVSTMAAQQAGDNEVQASGGFFHAQGSDTGSATGDLSYGYYLDNNWQVGLRQTLNYSFNDGFDDVWNLSTIPFVNYHFRGLSEGDRFQPFIGAFVGAAYNDQDVTGTLGPNVGAKYFVSDSSFFVVRYRYEWFFDELSVGRGTRTDNIDDGNHVVTVGFGVTW